MSTRPGALQGMIQEAIVRVVHVCTASVLAGARWRMFYIQCLYIGWSKMTYVLHTVPPYWLEQDDVCSTYNASVLAGARWRMFCIQCLCIGWSKMAYVLYIYNATIGATFILYYITIHILMTALLLCYYNTYCWHIYIYIAIHIIMNSHLLSHVCDVRAHAALWFFG